MPDGIMQYFAKIGLDVSEFMNGIGKADSGLLQFYRDVSVSMGMTMIIFDKFLQYGQKFIELSNQAAQYVSTIDKLAVTTGMSTEDLQRFTNVARYADDDITSLAASINKMQINLSAQGESGDKVRQMLDDMGVSYRNADGSLKSSAELFPAVIQGLKGLESSADRVTAANAIFGRSYQSLAGYMDMSTAAMKEHFDEAGVMTPKQTQAVRDYEIAAKNLDATIGHLSNTAGADMASSFREFTELMNDMADNEGIMSFFSALNGFLTLTARGFHILGAELQTTDQFLSGDVAGAMKTQEDLGRWVAQKTRDDAMRAAGYHTDGLGNVILEESTPGGNKLSTGAEPGGETETAKKVIESEIVLSGIENIKAGTMSVDDLKWAVDQGTISWQQYNDILGGLETSKIEDEIKGVVNLIEKHALSIEEVTTAYERGNIGAQEYADILNVLSTNKIEDQINVVDKLTDSISEMQDKLNESQRDYARDLQMLDPRDVQGFIDLKMRHEWDVEDLEGGIAEAQSKMPAIDTTVDDFYSRYEGAEINMTVTVDTAQAEAQIQGMIVPLATDFNIPESPEIAFPAPFLSQLPSGIDTRQMDTLHLPDVTLPGQVNNSETSIKAPAPVSISITGPIYLNGDKSFEKMLEDQRIRAGVRLR